MAPRGKSFKYTASSQHSERGVHWMIVTSPPLDKQSSTHDNFRVLAFHDAEILSQDCDFIAEKYMSVANSVLSEWQKGPGRSDDSIKGILNSQLHTLPSGKRVRFAHLAVPASRFSEVLAATPVILDTSDELENRCLQVSRAEYRRLERNVVFGPPQPSQLIHGLPAQPLRLRESEAAGRENRSASIECSKLTSRRPKQDFRWAIVTSFPGGSIPTESNVMYFHAFHTSSSKGAAKRLTSASKEIRSLLQQKLEERFAAGEPLSEDLAKQDKQIQNHLMSKEVQRAATSWPEDWRFMHLSISEARYRQVVGTTPNSPHSGDSFCAQMTDAAFRKRIKAFEKRESKRTKRSKGRTSKFTQGEVYPQSGMGVTESSYLQGERHGRPEQNMTQDWDWHMAENDWPYTQATSDYQSTHPMDMRMSFSHDGSYGPIRQPNAGPQTWETPLGQNQMSLTSYLPDLTDLPVSYLEVAGQGGFMTEDQMEEHCIQQGN